MKKAKRNHLIILLSLLLIGLVIYCGISLLKPKVKLIDFSGEKVSKINIFDGNTGKEIDVDERSDINKIISNLSTIEFVKGRENNRDGFSFAMIIYDLEGNKKDTITVNHSSFVIYDGYFYKDKSNSIDYEFIASLFKKYKNI